MATEDYYKTDWIIQINTNVNVANSRKWFSTFTAFDLHLGEGSNSIKVEGIGSITLRVRSDMKVPSKVSTIMIKEALLIPEFTCNMLGQPFLDDYAWTSGPLCAIWSHGDPDRRNPLGLCTNGPLRHLWLEGRKLGQSSLRELGGHFAIGGYWAREGERKWEKEKRQRAQLDPSANTLPKKNDSQPSWDPPYNDEERQWLKQRFGNEYSFLRRYGLSIYEEEDRAEGRAIVRAFMQEDDSGDERDGKRKRDASPEGPRTIGFAMKRRKD